MRLDLLLPFLGLISSCRANDWYLRAPSDNCTTGVDRTGFCSDCLTQSVCSADGLATSSISCEDGSVCYQDDEISACVEASLVEECSCPSSGLTLKPDKYDPNKFLICSDGNSAIESCGEGEIFYADVSSCEEVTTPTTSVTSTVSLPSCPSDGSFAIETVSCTQYIVCSSDGSSSGIQSCNPGEIFNNLTSSCDFYTIFSCADYAETGLYADTTNCSISHLCQGGEQIGEDNVCPSDLPNFNNETRECTDEPTDCSAVEDCGICPDADTKFKIDCYSYYQCTEVDSSSNSSLEYTPVVKTCPDGLVYNDVMEYCDLEENVEGCPESQSFGRRSWNVLNKWYY